MSNNFMSMASIAVTDQDKNLQPEGVSVVGMPPVTVNPVGVPVNVGICLKNALVCASLLAYLGLPGIHGILFVV